jgi:hypothetical protein
MCQRCALHFALTFLLNSVDHGFAIWHVNHPIAIAFRNLVEVLDTASPLPCEEEEEPKHKKSCGGGGA